MPAMRITCVFILSCVLVAEAGPRRRAARVPTPPLIVSTIEPDSGPIAGGSTVTIRGSGFFPSDLQVSFDGHPAASVTLGPHQSSATNPRTPSPQLHFPEQPVTSNRQPPPRQYRDRYAYTAVPTALRISLPMTSPPSSWSS